MNYPVWYLPEIGGGLLIAVIAILHVFVSHFAVGGGLYLIFAEKKGLRENNAAILAFTHQHARFFLLLTLVFGSITGVGIWFIIALINPAATSLLIHIFVFGWAAEWVFFTVEIAAAFAFYYLFGKMDWHNHLKVGWLYFISAWLSLFLINGIVCFMLTPGDWLNDNTFWLGFFNPSFLPALGFRTFAAFLLAGVYGYFSAATGSDRAVARTMTRFSARWALVSLVLCIPFAFWYVAVLPGPAQGLVLGKSPTIVTALQWGGAGLVVLLVISLVAGIWRPELNRRPVALVAMLCALVAFGGFEWIREAARRPYAINEVLYANMIFPGDVPRLSQDGFLRQAKWVNDRDPGANSQAAGEELFVHQCYACHTLGGFNNDLKAQTSAMSFAALQSYIQRIHQVRYFMPPFVGTDEEVTALATYIAQTVHGKEIPIATHAVPGKEVDGATLFDLHCAACHDTAEIKAAVAGMEPVEVVEILATLETISEEMTPFAGSSDQAAALAGYLTDQALSPSPPSTGEAGPLLFEKNCSICHAPGDIPELFSGYDQLAQIRDALGRLDELSAEMQPFAGSDTEKDQLATYLFQQERNGQ
ncbi:MAG: c-type cytochrome [Desulfopila sp.]